MTELSRRDFLKLGGAGLLGLFLAELDWRSAGALSRVDQAMLPDGSFSEEL